VCFHVFGNQIRHSKTVFTCRRCRIRVHPLCYGANEQDYEFCARAGADQWLCRACRCGFDSRVTGCEICGQKTRGVFKPTQYDDIVKSGGWAHMACAIWVPETWMRDSFLMEPITGILDIDKRRKKLQCVYCNRPGNMIQCFSYHCAQSFHPLCAYKHDPRLLPSVSVFEKNVYGFCLKHHPHRKIDGKTKKKKRDSFMDSVKPFSFFTNPEAKLECEKCGAKFRSESALRRHKKNCDDFAIEEMKKRENLKKRTGKFMAHSVPGDTIVTPLASSKCPFCDALFVAGNASFVKHLAAHRKEMLLTSGQQAINYIVMRNSTINSLCDEIEEKTKKLEKPKRRRIVLVAGRKRNEENLQRSEQKELPSKPKEKIEERAKIVPNSKPKSALTLKLPKLKPELTLKLPLRRKMKTLKLQLKRKTKPPQKQKHEKKTQQQTEHKLIKREAPMKKKKSRGWTPKPLGIKITAVSGAASSSESETEVSKHSHTYVEQTIDGDLKNNSFTNTQLTAILGQKSVSHNIYDESINFNEFRLQIAYGQDLIAKEPYQPNAQEIKPKTPTAHVRSASNEPTPSSPDLANVSRLKLTHKSPSAKAGAEQITFEELESESLAAVLGKETTDLDPLPTATPNPVEARLDVVSEANKTSRRKRKKKTPVKEFERNLVKLRLARARRGAKKEDEVSSQSSSTSIESILASHPANVEPKRKPRTLKLKRKRSAKISDTSKVVKKRKRPTLRLVLKKGL